MAEIVKIDSVGFQNLMNQLKVRLPDDVDHLAQSAIAKTATTGRKREQNLAMPKLKMGNTQLSTVRGGELVIRTFSQKTEQGWASTTRKGKKGKPFALAHFAWERAKKTKNKQSAAYTSQLANLWGNPTKPYSKRSPVIGNPERPKQWKEGQVRERRYFWSMTEAVMRDSIAEGIRKAEEAEKTRPDGVLR